MKKMTTHIYPSTANNAMKDILHDGKTSIKNQSNANLCSTNVYVYSLAHHCKRPEANRQQQTENPTAQVYYHR